MREREKQHYSSVTVTGHFQGLALFLYVLCKKVHIVESVVPFCVCIPSNACNGDESKQVRGKAIVVVVVCICMYYTIEA